MISVMENAPSPVHRAHGLSKSRLTALAQCPKRLWLQVHRPEEAAVDPGREARFAVGHEIGALACSLIPEGIMIEAEPNLAAALKRTADLIRNGVRQPLFEATFAHQGVLVRVDVMEPVDDGSWHVAEVKSSTSRKDYHLADLATQLWVMRENGITIESASIRHINNGFTLLEEGRYEGLLTDTDSLVEAQAQESTQSELASRAREILAGIEPTMDIGDHCDSPFSCEFSDYCRKGVPYVEWPIRQLPNTGKRLAGEWADKGIFELLDLAPESLSNATHRRIHQATRTGVAFHDRERALRDIADWAWPRSYLDFETITFAIPRWVGTRPWQQIPFQFSVHVEEEDGAIEHREFLVLDGTDPRRACAEALISHLPAAGAIIAYFSSFERARVKDLAEHFSDLAGELLAIADRIVDLLPVTRNCWYHRDQRGSWSIKAVLPTISGASPYKNLAVQDGGAAQLAFAEAIAFNCTPDRRDKIAADLRRYCGLDTEAMILVLHHLIADGPNSE